MKTSIKLFLIMTLFIGITNFLNAQEVYDPSEIDPKLGIAPYL